MTDEAMDNLITGLMQRDDWPAVMRQLQEWMRTGDPRLDALFDCFAKVTPRSVREARIKTYLLIASMSVLALSHLNGFVDDDVLNDAVTLNELRALLANNCA